MVFEELGFSFSEDTSGLSVIQMPFFTLKSDRTENRNCQPPDCLIM